MTSEEKRDWIVIAIAGTVVGGLLLTAILNWHSVFDWMWNTGADAIAWFFSDHHVKGWLIVFVVIGAVLFLALSYLVYVVLQLAKTGTVKIGPSATRVEAWLRMKTGNPRTDVEELKKLREETTKQKARIAELEKVKPAPPIAPAASDVSDQPANPVSAQARRIITHLALQGRTTIRDLAAALRTNEGNLHQDLIKLQYELFYVTPDEIDNRGTASIDVTANGRSWAMENRIQVKGSESADQIKIRELQGKLEAVEKERNDLAKELKAEKGFELVKPDYPHGPAEQGLSPPPQQTYLPPPSPPPYRGD